MPDPLRTFLDFSEYTFRDDPAANPCEAEDACQLHLLEGVSLPAFCNEHGEDATAAEFISWFRARAEADPALLGGLSPHDAGRLMAAQERLLPRFNRQKFETAEAARDDEKRGLMRREHDDEVSHPIGGHE